MKGKIKNIVPVGKVKMYLIWLEEFGVFGRTYSGSIYRNYDYWRDLKIGDWVVGLEWKDKKKAILDADSPIQLNCGTVN
jgi:hypothetical protein